MVKTVLFALLMVAVAHVETMHITGVRRATEAEKTYKTSFNQNFITGTLDGKQYTLEQLATWGTYNFQVGQDYEVLKATDKQVKLRVTDKKGRESTESLNVVGIAEQ
ncbi:hypothetical protein [Occallatibacter savannae]|uniref:hypothetical protein n=1 Tax=Occallatibacter savannae TaxID=1002691 RepID=UPI000D69BCC6|nr:hypothetical protein [Occallatibacter savannae]